MSGKRPRTPGVARRVPGARELNRAATRQEILQAGRKLFSTKGLYDSRIEDITRSAGIAKGTLYLYFRSKEELVLAVVECGFQELHAELSERLRDRELLADLAAGVFTGHIEYFDRNQDLMRVFHQVRGVLKFDMLRWRPLRELLRGHVDFLAGELARGEAADWPLTRRRDLAIFLFGCASGTSSVLVSTYPESGDLGRFSLRWAEWVARAAGGAAQVPRSRSAKRS